MGHQLKRKKEEGAQDKAQETSMDEVNLGEQDKDEKKDSPRQGSKPRSHL
jgi:hypothetical protein